MRESNPHGYDAITLFRSDKHAYATLRIGCPSRVRTDDFPFAEGPDYHSCIGHRLIGGACPNRTDGGRSALSGLANQRLRPLSQGSVGASAGVRTQQRGFGDLAAYRRLAGTSLILPLDGAPCLASE